MAGKSTSHWGNIYETDTQSCFRKVATFHTLFAFNQRFATLYFTFIWIRSKWIHCFQDAARTLSSAEANLAGFLSFPNYRKFNGFLNLQPIPVEVFPVEEDYLLATSKQCDRYDYIMVEYLKKDDNYVSFWRHFGPLVEYLEENTGRKINTILDIAFVYETLNNEREKFDSYVIVRGLCLFHQMIISISFKLFHS